jgi:WD40 repeat protein
MKTELRNFVMGAGLTVMLWAPLLKAEESLVVAKIPFDFQVNQTALPAGTYTVIMDSNVVTIRLRNNETGKSILVMPPGRDSSKSEPKLSFHHYGDHYFLSGIYTDGNPGYTLHKGSLEREIERGGATVAVAYIPVESR